MAKHFSARLAVNNIINNRKFYLPYFLASTGIIAMFYILCFLAQNEGVSELAITLSSIMWLGCGIMGIFSFVFIFYINSFLMKRRTKEIGLYNILGMEKRHIGRIMAIESLLVSLANLTAGLFCGIVFSKFIHLLISRVFGGEPPFGIEISLTAIVITTVCFGTLFCLTLLWNQTQLRLSKPVDLLYGGKKGEQEPKSKWILALVGLLCLSGGYAIAIVVDSPLQAVFLFFVAVVLVIIGTYCLFTAGSIVALKALRKKKKIYYRPGNFTAISGLIYRMKQNAVGLANICILSTMVLVMFSGTVSLYAGMKDIAGTMISADLCVQIQYEETELDEEKIEKLTKQAILEEGGEISSIQPAHYFSFAVTKEDENFVFSGNDSWGNTTVTCFSLVTRDQYATMTGEILELEKDEVAVYSKGTALADTFELGGEILNKKYTLSAFPVLGNLGAMACDVNYLVVADDSVYHHFYQMQKKAYGEAASPYEFQLAVDLAGEISGGESYQNSIMNALYSQNIGDPVSLQVENRESLEDGLYGLIGGFLFLGIFLGIVFTFAAALIIYYKQISEGYYDKDKFEIMQKVGMSKDEVKKSIKKQVLFVFFIPLIMAGIHVLAAFKMITRLLLIFGMSNVQLFALCTIITYLVFTAIYAFVYAVTAREYYKIVG